MNHLAEVEKSLTDNFNEWKFPSITCRLRVDDDDNNAASVDDHNPAADDEDNAVPSALNEAEEGDDDRRRSCNVEENENYQ